METISTIQLSKLLKVPHADVIHQTLKMLGEISQSILQNENYEIIIENDDIYAISLSEKLMLDVLRRLK